MATRPSPTRTVEHRPATADRPAIELVRSTRRRRGAAAFVRGGRIVVQLPAGLPATEETRIVERLVDRVSGRERARRIGGDAALEARARRLADDYLDGVQPAWVRWSSRMRSRWGSCTPGPATIRVSDRLARFPAWVLDYVLVHELAHLQERGHGPRFDALVARYPHAERARGFLAGVEWADAQASGPDSSSPSVSSDEESASEPSSSSGAVD